MSFYRGTFSAIVRGVLATAMVSSLTGLSTISAAQTAALKTTLPLVFEQNAGQLPQGALFAGRAQNYSLEVRPTELRFAMAGKPAGRTIAIGFSGAQPARTAGLDEARFRTNYYIGNEPGRWHTDVHNYQRIALRDLYPGIDAQFYSHDGEIEHDFLLAPNADPSQLSMRLSGARAIRISGDGDLLLDAEQGALRLHKPQAYQLLADGTRRTVAANFHLQRAKNKVADLSFTLGQYDHSRALVIDPVITYATYVTGSAGSTPTGIVSDASGNVYLTGTTSSPIASFAAAASSGSGDPAGGQTTAFVAKLAAETSGSQIAWLSYYGSGTKSVSASAIAINPAAATVFVGGSSQATDLPTSPIPFQTAPAARNGAFGFVASFATATGQFSAGTYIDTATTGAGSMSVGALAVTAASVTIAGSTTDTDLTVTSNALPLLASETTNTQLTKGFVLTLNTALTTESYGTYVAGDLFGSGYGAYPTGVAVDSSGNIYVAGSTYGNFPRSGSYGNNFFGPPPSQQNQNGFAAQLIAGAASTTIGYSYWTGGDSNDTVNGLMLDAGNNLYVFGNTTSHKIVGNASTSSSYSPNPTLLTPLQDSYPTGETSAGFFSKIDAQGGLQVTSYLTSSTPASSSTVTGAAVDASGNLYFSGSTDGRKADFPSQSSGIRVSAPLLPAGAVPQDLTQESAAPPFISRGYVLQLAPSITSVTGLAYTGPSNGRSYGVGLALDSAASPNAYILSRDLPSGGGDYVTASAAQTGPQVGTGSTSSAYVARIAFAAAASGSIVAGTGSHTPTAAYLSATQYTTETLIWQITGAGAGATAVVFNLPYSQFLQPYTLSMLTLNGAAVTASQCAVGTATVANIQPGITCVLPTLASGETDTFALTDGVTSAVAARVSGGVRNVSIAASAYDAQGDSLGLTQIVAIAGVPTLTLTNTVNGVASATVNAALSIGDTTTPNTAVSYVYTIENTSSYDSPNTQLTTDLGSSTYTFSVTSTNSSTGCDPTTATNGCDVPAGGTLTYTVSGVYLDAQFNSATPGPFTASTGAPSVSYAAVSNAPAVSGTPVTVTIDVNPTIANVSPNGGPLAGGTIVTITGTHFSGTPAVTFGSVAAASVSLVNANTITATAPPGAGTVGVTVSVAGQVLTLTNAFTYYAPQAYTVTTLTDDATGVATHCVNGVTTGNTCSLRDAIAAANGLPGGVTASINFAGSLTSGATPANPAVYSVGANGRLNITGNVTIQGTTSGSGRSPLIAVDGGSSIQVFNVASTATAAITNLILQNGKNKNCGAGIGTYGALTLAGDILHNNVSQTEGGGLCVNSGTATVIGSTFSGNQGAEGGGGVFVISGTVTIDDSTVSGNTASPTGGGIYVYRGTVTISNSTVSGNTASSEIAVGGGIFIGVDGTVNLYDSIVAGNSATGPSTADPDIAGKPGAISGSLVNLSNPQLSALGSYGGATPTMVPLPGSPAICAASVNYVTPAPASNQAFTDQRGATHSAAYCTPGQLDAGAVQTSYSLRNVFTVQPPSVVAPGVAITPNPSVTVTENGIGFSGAPVTMSAASGTIGGSTSAISAATTGIAAFNNLTITGAQPNDDLIATLALNSAAVPSAALSLTSTTFGSLMLSAPAVLTGQAGVVYSQGVAAANGAGPYTYTVTSAGPLPAGLSLGATSGAISGTPAAVGSFPVTVQVTDTGSSATASVSFALVISAPKIVVTAQPVAFPTLTVGVAPSFSFTASGGTGSYTYSLNGTSLPGGLTLNPATGAVTGTPAAAGPYSFTVTVTDSTSGTGAPFTGSQSYSGTAGKGTVTVTFTAATLTQTYTGSPLQAAATISPSAIPTSELTYTYAGSGSTVYASSTTPPTNAGTYTVSASLTDATYIGSAAAVAFSIDAAPLTITAGSYSGAYDGQTHALSACVVSSNPDGLTCTNNPSGPVGPNVSTGAVTPVPSASTANYVVTLNKGSLSITTLAASVTPNPGSKTYGAANPVLTGTLSGFLPADGVTAAFSRTSGETVAGSPYTISATLLPVAKLSNYTITTNKAVFTITKATPVVTWATPAAVAYGAALNATQLNAATTVPGTFVYTPAAATVIVVGQTLSVTFTPTDSADYNVAKATVQIAVAKAVTTTTVTSNLNPSAIGQPVTFTATITSTSASGETGTVTWAPALCSVTMVSAGVAKCTTLFAPVGIDTITATYSGDSHFTGSSGSLSGGQKVLNVLKVSTPVLTFSNADYGSSQTQTLTLTNNGATAITLLSITVPQANLPGRYAGTPWNFQLTNLCPSSLAAGKSCSVNVKFTATGPGVSPCASVEIVSNAVNSPQFVTLESNILEPVATVTPAKLVFANQKAGTTSSVSLVTLQNTGKGPLALTALTASGNFALASGTTCTKTTTLQPNAKCSLAVVFAPTSTGSKTGSITITDVSTSPTLTIPLQGTGN